MADGPNQELNFSRGILNAHDNLREIVRYLRFHRSEQMYQDYLRDYLPKLALPEYKESFLEFVGDYKDEVQRQKLLDDFAAKENAVRELQAKENKESGEVVASPAPVTELVVKEEVVEKPKKGRKKKHS